MAEPKATKLIVIVAGPNDAGKTTFAAKFLPSLAGSVTFINADSIARRISPSSPENAAIEAGKMLLRHIDELIRRGDNIAIETTLSGRNYARRIPEWQKLGYHVKLVYLTLSSVDLAMTRVKTRAAQGGHGIPEAVIRRRFDLGLKNFETLYRTLANSWTVYDNSGAFPVLERSSNEA